MIIADTHVHIYPSYDLELFFRSAFRNLSRFGSGKILLCLTERSDCYFFSEHLKRETATYGSFSLSALGGEIKVRSSDGKELSILPGRQVATAERIEVIGLGTNDFPEDRTPARECIEFFNRAGAVVVLPWSLGKWTGERGKLVRELIEDSQLQFVLGDPAHRPAILPEPKLFEVGKRNGRRILCGTDPLPLPKEEQRVGKYASVFADASLPGGLREPLYQTGERLMPWQSALRVAGLARRRD